MVFRDSMVKNMEEFFQFFGARNLVDDQELATLVERARSVMQGVTTEELRTNDLMRDLVRERMEQVKAEMDLNLMVRPSRRLFLDREEVKA
jgi:hypothetical protein